MGFRILIHAVSERIKPNEFKVFFYEGSSEKVGRLRCCNVPRKEKKKGKMISSRREGELE